MREQAAYVGLTSARIYIWPWIGISHHRETYHFNIFQKKTPEIKHHLEQDHSNSILPYHVSQQPRHGSCFLLPTSFKRGLIIQANELKT